MGAVPKGIRRKWLCTLEIIQKSHTNDYALTNDTYAIIDKILRCRVILDTACDTNFIKESFAKDLGLTMESLPTTELGGFGNQKKINYKPKGSN